jgi:hypothetical protein
MTIKNTLGLRERAAEFHKTGWTYYPYEARVEGHQWLLGINDFPDEPLYSLYVDGRRVEDFSDWPNAWVRPGAEVPPVVRTDRGPRERPVEWRRTASAEFPYESEVEGQRWQLRVNDFPAEPFYSVLVDSEERDSFDTSEVPEYWKLPRSGGAE